MKEFMRSVQIASAVACVLVASGCIIAGRGHAVSKVESYPVADRKPSVYIAQFDKKQKVDNLNKGVPWTMLATGYREDTVTRFDRSGLFARVAGIDFGSEYTISLELFTVIDFDAQLRVCSVVTLGLFPSCEKRTYQLTAYIKDNKSGTVLTVKSMETAECWGDLLLLPIAIFNPPRVREGEIYNDLTDNISIAVRDAIVKHEQAGSSVLGLKTVVTEKPVMNTDEVGLIKKLRALKDAREAGVLTEQEYQTKRAELLNGL